jgi:hypothetical protein
LEFSLHESNNLPATYDGLCGFLQSRWCKMLSVDSLSGIGCQQPWSPEGNSQRFSIHKFLWVYEVPFPFRIHSVVLCTEFLLFGERKKEKVAVREERERDRLLSGSQQPQCPGFQRCYGL